jgi:hypothetical protein
MQAKKILVLITIGSLMHVLPSFAEPKDQTSVQKKKQSQPSSTPKKSSKKDAFDPDKEFPGFKEQKPYYPFRKNSKLEKSSPLRDIALTNVSLKSLNKGKKNIYYLQGTSTILKAKCLAKVFKTKDTIYIKAEPQETIYMSTIVPLLKIPPLNQINFQLSSLVISSSKCNDIETDIVFPAGFSVHANANLHDLLKVAFDKILSEADLKSFFKNIPKYSHITFWVEETDIHQKLKLTASIPIDMNLEAAGRTVTTINNNLFMEYTIPLVPTAKKDVQKKEFGLAWLLTNFYTMILPNVGVESLLSIKLFDNLNPFQFLCTLTFAGPYIGGVNVAKKIPKFHRPTIRSAGTMQGELTNLFGVTGFNLSNVAIEYVTSMLPPFETLEFGITGKIQLGSAIIDLMLKLGAKKTHISIGGYEGKNLASGSYKGKLSTTDLLSIPFKQGLKIPVDKLPSLTVEDIALYFSDSTFSIGEIAFRQGLTIKGKVNLSNFGPINFSGAQGLVDISINLLPFAQSIGLEMKGSIPQIKLANLLEVSGPGLDPKTGENPGPMMKLELTDKKQVLQLSGSIKLFGTVAKKADILVSPEGASFSYSDQIADLFDCTITGKTVGKDDDLDFKITGGIIGPKKITFNRDDFNDWIGLLDKEMSQIKDAHEQKMRSINAKIKTKQDDMYKNNIAYKTAVDMFEKTLDEVNKVQKTVTSLDKDIDEITRRIQELKKELTHWARSTNENHYTKQPEALLTNNSAYTTKQLLAWNPISSVKKAAKSVSSAVQNTAADAKRTAEKAARAAKEASEKAAQKVKNVGGKLLNKAQATAELTAKTTELTAKFTAKNTALVVLKGLKLSLQAADESVKNFDTEIIAWRALQATLLADLTAQIASITVLKGMLETARAGAKSLDWLTDIGIQSLEIEASLKDMVTKGIAPTTKINISAFNLQKTITVQVPTEDIIKVIKQACFDLFKERKK